MQVFLPGESPWTEAPGRLQPVGMKSQTRLSNEAEHSAHDPVTVFFIVLGLFSVGLFLLLCFLPKEVPLASVVKLV